MKHPVLIFGLIFITAIAAYLLFNRPQTLTTESLPIEPVLVIEDNLEEPAVVAVVPADSVVAEPTAPAEAVTVEPTIEVERAVQLDGSDEAVIAVMSTLNPSLLQWFNQDELVRKIVMAVDRVASGEIPTNHLPLTYAKAMFKVNETAISSVEEEPMYTVASENYARFQPLISALHVIEPATLAAYYQDWLPILEQAYTEMGMETTFDQRFHQALDQVLAVRDLASDTPLTQPHVFYEYQDPEFENANAVHKFIWRLGPDNSRSLQNYLRAFKRAL